MEWSANFGKWQCQVCRKTTAVRERLLPCSTKRAHRRAHLRGDLVARDHALDPGGAAQLVLHRKVHHALAVARADVDERRVRAKVPRARPAAAVEAAEY